LPPLASAHYHLTNHLILFGLVVVAQLIDFTVTVQNRGDEGADTFSILFHSVPIVKRSGQLSKGTIELHRRY
jgi:phage-related holin